MRQIHMIPYKIRESVQPTILTDITYSFKHLVKSDFPYVNFNLKMNIFDALVVPQEKIIDEHMWLGIVNTVEKKGDNTNG